VDEHRKAQATSFGSSAFFYGWWIVGVASLNLFFSVGLIYYGLPVYYPAIATALGFTRAQLTQGFLLGFLVVGIPFTLLAGSLIDRLGARLVILSGVGFVGIPLILMGSIRRFWQFEMLCLMEVVGYALAGPIANQVLISRWFKVRRGQAMGYAYLGLGLGGVAAPVLSNYVIRAFGWRHALEATGLVVLAVLFPVGFWGTRSAPADMALLPDGADPAHAQDQGAQFSKSVEAAIRMVDFWLLLIGSTLVLGAINAVIQHFVLFLQDQGYSTLTASRFLSALLVASLAGRVLVGYLADRLQRKNTMAFFYLLLGVSIPLLFFARQTIAACIFAGAFGFAMGADYMLIPLVTADRFGMDSLGKLLALITAGNYVFQWLAPWTAGKLFDTYRSYDPAWKLMTAAAVLGAAAIYGISVPSRRVSPTGAELQCGGS
jgi:MFS family permease